ncbi:bacteriorhodopsin [Paenibacillus sp. 4624]
MRIILPIIASILSIGGGWLFGYLIMLLMLSGDEGLIIFDVPPASHTLLYLVLTLLPFVVLVYFLTQKRRICVH